GIIFAVLVNAVPIQGAHFAHPGKIDGNRRTVIEIFVKDRSADRPPDQTDIFGVVDKGISISLIIIGSIIAIYLALGNRILGIPFQQHVQGPVIKNLIGSSIEGVLAPAIGVFPTGHLIFITGGHIKIG